MGPNDKAKIERMIMRVESTVQAGIEGVHSPTVEVVSPDRLRRMIEEAIDRYHAEPHPNPVPEPINAWSASLADRRNRA